MTNHEQQSISMNILQNIRIGSRLQVWAFAVLITTVILIASLGITHTTVALSNTSNPCLIYELAFVVPLVTALPTSYLLVQVIYQLQQTHHKLLQLAYTDELTALANRRNFFAQGERMVKVAQASGKAAALLLFDVNDFKPINDTWGHAAGDEALRSIAGVLKHFARPEDLIARLGGDEFALLRANTTRKELATLVAQIRQQLTQVPYEYNGAILPLTISMGMSDTSQAASLEALLHIGDMALYAAKVEHHGQANHSASVKSDPHSRCQICPVR